MTTYIFPVQTVTTSYVNTQEGETIAVSDSSTLEIVVTDGTATFAYDLASATPGPIFLQSSAIQWRLDGTLIAFELDFAAAFSFLWTTAGETRQTSVLALTYEQASGTDVEIYFDLAGTALPDFISVRTYDSFAASIDRSSVSLVTGSFAAGENIAYLALPGASTTQDDLIGMNGVATNEIDAGAGNDTVFGNTDDETIFGGLGDDFILAAAGHDSLDGGDGFDTLYAGDGADTLSGGARADELGGGAGDDLLDGDAGYDTLWGAAGQDTLRGGDGNDQLGGGGDGDSIEGGAGRDKLWGSFGDDSLFGGDDDDEVWGSVGNNLMSGGLGHDRLGGLGNDTINGNSGNDTIYAASGDDVVDGGADADTIYGGTGHDTLFGWTGDDLVFGFTGDDRIEGGTGNDTLYAGLGNDTVDGGAGDDHIHLAAGADLLVFSRGSDTVTGFVAAQGDILDLSRFSAISDLSDFRTNHSADTSEGLLIFDGTGETTLLQGLIQDDLNNSNLIFFV